MIAMSLRSYLARSVGESKRKRRRVSEAEFKNDQRPLMSNEETLVKKVLKQNLNKDPSTMKNARNAARICALGVLLSAVSISAQAQGEDQRRVSAIYYAPGFPNIMGFAQLENSADAAIAKASQQCEAKSGGDCYQGLVYDQCGAVSEMQMGNPEGNPKGWAPAATLQQALDLSMRQCNYYASKHRA